MNHPVLLTLLSAALLTGLPIAPAGPDDRALSPQRGWISPVMLAADDEKTRAEKATDNLTPAEENTEMPLPGQGYSHGSPLLDKAKDRKKTDAAIDDLKARGKIATDPPAGEPPARQAD